LAITGSLGVFALLVWTWVLSLCSSFPPLLGALFNEVYQGFFTFPTFFDKTKEPAYVNKKNTEYT
jgi:hypothetical protein